jgi:tetratricopeptide (TPR) repeat protein
VLEDLASEEGIATQPSQTLFLLTRALLRSRASPEKVLEQLRRTQEAYPGDFWANHHLGMALGRCQPPQHDEAIRFLTAAVALRPNSAGAYVNLGLALKNKGRVADAVAAYRRAIKLKPDYGNAHYNLGQLLRDQGDLPGAAVAFCRTAELNPKNAEALHNLGHILMVMGDVPQAADCFRRGLETGVPDHVIRAGLHRNLGIALQDLGDQEGAVDQFDRAVESNPKDAQAHYHLGLALEAREDFARAIACYRRAVDLDSKHAYAQWNLGTLLLQQGDLDAALTALRRGHELGSQRKNWPTAKAMWWIGKCERFRALDGRLPKILKGEARPANVVECLQLAELCECKKLHVSSVRFWTDGFAGDPKLAEDFRTGFRFGAARSAALAASGQGEEAAQLDAAERARLRRKALDWLRADLAAWNEYMKRRPVRSPIPEAQEAFHTWQTTSALAGVREAGALASLPDEERADWQKLWDDVAAALARARGAK